MYWINFSRNPYQSGPRYLSRLILIKNGSFSLFMLIPVYALRRTIIAKRMPTPTNNYISAFCNLSYNNYKHLLSATPEPNSDCHFGIPPSYMPDPVR